MEASTKAHSERISALEAIVKAHDERISRLEAAVEKLVNAASSLEAAVRAHSERISALEAIVKVHSERIDALEAAVRAHDERISRLEAAVEKLVNAVLALEAAVKVHSERIDALERAVNALREVAERHERRLTRIERDLRAMRTTLDRLSVSLEEEANDVVQHLLKQKGSYIATEPVRFDKKYEFDIYGTDGRVTVVGEAKVRVGPRTVQRVAKRIDEARRLWPHRFPGEVVKVVYCMRATPEAVAAAESAGVWLIESMKERTRLELSA